MVMAEGGGAVVVMVAAGVFLPPPVIFASIHRRTDAQSHSHSLTHAFPRSLSCVLTFRARLNMC